MTYLVPTHFDQVSHSTSTAAMLPSLKNSLYGSVKREECVEQRRCAVSRKFLGSPEQGMACLSKTTSGHPERNSNEHAVCLRRKNSIPAIDDSSCHTSTTFREENDCTLRSGHDDQRYCASRISKENSNHLNEGWPLTAGPTKLLARPRTSSCSLQKKTVPQLSTRKKMSRPVTSWGGKNRRYSSTAKQLLEKNSDQSLISNYHEANTRRCKVESASPTTAKYKRRKLSPDGPSRDCLGTPKRQHSLDFLRREASFRAKETRRTAAESERASRSEEEQQRLEAKMRRERIEETKVLRRAEVYAMNQVMKEEFDRQFQAFIKRKRLEQERHVDSGESQC